ncbi:Vacuolar protein sorting-associated protein ist1 [Chamberlinius hualienensis]
MFSNNLSKLKTNLRLSVNRLKLLEKKKTELAQKARKEIADYISSGKVERARIRVEHIIREDYLVEAMEVIEMYCDLLLARFGLIQQMKTLDEGLAEGISSLIWAAPRLQTDVPELKIISDQLTQKYGKQYALACRDNAVSTVNEKLMHKLSVEAPKKILVEKYLVEIAKSHNVPYEPDPDVMIEEDTMTTEAILIDFGGFRPGGNDGASGGAGGGGGGMPEIGFKGASLPQQQSYSPFNYPDPKGNQSAFSNAEMPPPLPLAPPASAPYPSLINKLAMETNDFTTVPPADDMPVPSYDDAIKSKPADPKPMPMPRGKTTVDTLPELPTVPTGSLSNDVGGESTSDDVDFDDLAKRFEALKKKK